MLLSEPVSPDNPNPPTAMYSAEIVELDEFIIFINDNMPCPFEVKYRTGLYALVTFSLQHGRTVAPWEGWIKERNRALVPRWSQIEADFRTVLKNFSLLSCLLFSCYQIKKTVPHQAASSSKRMSSHNSPLDRPDC